MKKYFYITTTLPYVNADPHVGFAMEIVRADSVARYKKLMGYEVFFNTGTDEHGQKIYDKAIEQKSDPQAYVDKHAEKFKDLIKILGLSPDINFIRTTDVYHIKAAQEFWNKCKAAGDIYKKTYRIKYCVGCELEKTDSELVNGHCPIHPNLEIQPIEEENYFFKFSKYQKPLLDLYQKQKHFVIPDFRFNEIKAFVERGLEDFSISRLKSKMSWGVPVPDDVDHVMYVWFDALVNYVSAIGWPTDMKKFETWWPVVQYAGKDNLRQQSAMWQAMLMSAGISPSEQIVINGFITGAGGMKMSKSLGNVINPIDVVKEYGTDALRYFVLREISSFEDSPFDMDLFKRAYNNALANGLGNLSSRIMKLASTNLSEPIKIPKVKTPKELAKAVDSYDLKSATDIIWAQITELDGDIQKTQPFKVIKEDQKKGKEIITDHITRLYQIADLLTPFLPETSQKIKDAVANNTAFTEPLFPRKD